MNGTLRRFGLKIVSLIFIAPFSIQQSSADTVIDSPVTVQLQPVAMEKDGSTYYKFGIWVSLGGSSTPQLFEFDTGGSGFYAAYSNTVSNNWWGSDVTSTGNEVHNHYGSGIEYKGLEAITSLSLYDPGSNVAKLTTSQDIHVGQTYEIKRDGNLVWPNETDAPPVEGNFYGDFGLSLAPKSGNEKDVNNVFSQFSYGSGVVGAFIVSLRDPTQGGTSQVQIGVTTDDIASFPIQFTMNTKPDGSYSAELITAHLTLGDANSSIEMDLPINLDTGTPTPTFHEFTDYIPTDLTDPDTNTIIPGAVLDLFTTGDLQLFYQLVANTDYGVNQMDIKSDGGSNYLNIGTPFFYGYDVLFDFENGIVGLRPVPEPGTFPFMAVGLLTLCFVSLRRLHLVRRQTAV